MLLQKPLTFSRSSRTIPNRLAVAAMTNKQSNPDGTLHDDELRWLEARAFGGFGLIKTCATFVSEDGRGWANELGVHDDAMIPGLRRLAGVLQAHGALVMPQIFHGGVRAPSSLTGEQPWSASSFVLDSPGFEVPREGTEEDIARTIKAFADAARRCEEAGMDGVEIHGAHGYLITQFLGSFSNQRTDGWGGNLDRRMRFLKEILRAVKAATSDRFVVGVRISPEYESMGVDLDESLEVAEWIAAEADFLHVSLWDSFAPSRKYPSDPLPLTTKFKEVSGDCPLMIAGSIWTLEEAQRVMEQGADVVALGRAAIANPDWPKRVVQGGLEPARPPLTEAELLDRALSPAFVEYMKRWKGFVKT